MPDEDEQVVVVVVHEAEGVPCHHRLDTHRRRLDAAIGDAYTRQPQPPMPRPRRPSWEAGNVGILEEAAEGTIQEAAEDNTGNRGGVVVPALLYRRLAVPPRQPPYESEVEEAWEEDRDKAVDIRPGRLPWRVWPMVSFSPRLVAISVFVSYWTW